MNIRSHPCGYGDFPLCLLLNPRTLGDTVFLCPLAPGIEGTQKGQEVPWELSSLFLISSLDSAISFPSERTVTFQLNSGLSCLEHRWIPSSGLLIHTAWAALCRNLRGWKFPFPVPLEIILGWSKSLFRFFHKML